MWWESLRRTYWFIKLVLPTPLSPRMMTFKRIFLREDMMAVCAGGGGGVVRDLGARVCGGGWKRNTEVAVLRWREETAQAVRLLSS